MTSKRNLEHVHVFYISIVFFNLRLGKYAYFQISNSTFCNLSLSLSLNMCLKCFSWPELQPEPRVSAKLKAFRGFSIFVNPKSEPSYAYTRYAYKKTYTFGSGHTKFQIRMQNYAKVLRSKVHKLLAWLLF